MLHLLVILAAEAAETMPTPSENEFHLLCHGNGQNQVATYSSGVGFFGHIGAVLGTNTQLQNFDDDVRVDIQSSLHKITLPGRFLAPIHKKTTTFDMEPLVINDDTISGKISVNWANHPNFRINRHTGVIEMDGSLGNFSGKCEKTDPNQRAF